MTTTIEQLVLDHVLHVDEPRGFGLLGQYECEYFIDL